MSGFGMEEGWVFCNAEPCENPGSEMFETWPYGSFPKNRGNPCIGPKYHNAYYGDSPTTPPILGNPHSLKWLCFSV